MLNVQKLEVSTGRKFVYSLIWGLNNKCNLYTYSYIQLKLKVIDEEGLYSCKTENLRAAEESNEFFAHSCNA
jgi:predicted AAA+ superfamily ATPase